MIVCNVWLDVIIFFYMIMLFQTHCRQKNTPVSLVRVVGPYSALAMFSPPTRSFLPTVHPLPLYPEVAVSEQQRSIHPHQLRQRPDDTPGGTE